MRWSGLGWVLLLGLGACAGPDLQSVSSGQIGCSENQVRISHDQAGWGTRTWIAQCKGKRFFCVAVATGRESQVNCKEDLGDSAKQAAVPQSESQSAKPRKMDSEPPASAGGFKFGSTIEEAEAECTQAGKEWSPATEGHYSCSGMPTSIGPESKATLRFCEQKLCTIAIDVDSPSAWMRSYTKLRQVLKAKYGEPVSSKGELRDECRSEAAFTECVMKQELRLSVEWKWDSGERIRLKVGAGDAAPKLQLVYTHQGAHAPVADAL